MPLLLTAFSAQPGDERNGVVMRKTVVLLLGLAVLVLGAVWIVAATGADETGTFSSQPGSMMSTGVDGGSEDDFAMMPCWSGRSGRGDGTGMGSGMMDVENEADYLVAMIPHHEEAILAAEELARSDRPEMRELGEDIVASQTAQIEQMRTYLADWYPDTDTSSDYEPMMRDLSGLSGDALDQAFLQDMIPHHMVAVMMSQRLLMHGDAEHGEIDGLARDISAEQRREIAMMRTWLVAWFSG